MNIREVLRQTASSIAAHKLRSFLTMFGIIWGITSVILLVGLGKGFSRDQKERLKTIGVDLAIIWGGRTSEQAGGYAAGRQVRLSIHDAYIDQAGSVPDQNRQPRTAAQCRRSQPLQRGIASGARSMAGLSELSLAQSAGRPADDRRRRERKAGAWSCSAWKSRDQLFPGKPAIGETLTMNGSPYTVIGVLEKKKQNGSYGSGPDNTQLFVPYSSMARDYPPPERPGISKGWINNLVVEVADPDHHEEAMQQVYQILGREHHFDPGDKDALFIWDTLEGSKLVERIFDIMTIFFGAVALMTLSLGGIGVMNIMLVAVTERTREIGVRKSLGATARDIRNQFFAESAALMLISGAIRTGHRRWNLFCSEQRAAARYRAPSRHFAAGDHRVVVDVGTDHGRRRNVSGAARRRAQSDRVSAAGVENVEICASRNSSCKAGTR